MISLFCHCVTVLLAVCVVGFFISAAFAYRSEQLVVLAEGGRKTVTEYEAFVNKAIHLNPWNSQALVKQADILISKQRHREALQILAKSSHGKFHWQGWERRGIATEHLAFSPAGMLEDAQHAGHLYDKVLRVHPVHARGLERRALLALKMGDWTTAQDVAYQLTQLGSSNGNATYIRALIASGLRKQELAENLFGQLLSQEQESSNSLFTKTEIQSLLQQMVEKPN